MLHKIFLSVKEVLYKLYFILTLNRPSKDHYVAYVTDDAVKHDIFSFRYNIYCLTDRLLDAANYPNQIEFDEFDKSSYQFGVFDNRNRVVGTFRLIICGDDIKKFPTEEEFGLIDVFTERTRTQTVEISRFMLEKKFRKSIVLLNMMKAVYQFSKQHDIQYWHGCAEQWFITTLNSIIGPLAIIQKPKYCFNAINYPFILSVSDTERNVKKKGWLLWRFFTTKSINVRI